MPSEAARVVAASLSIAREIIGAADLSLEGERASKQQWIERQVAALTAKLRAVESMLLDGLALDVRLSGPDAVDLQEQLEDIHSQLIHLRAFQRALEIGIQR